MTTAYNLLILVLGFAAGWLLLSNLRSVPRTTEERAPRSVSVVVPASLSTKPDPVMVRAVPPSDVAVEGATEVTAGSG